MKQICVKTCGTSSELWIDGELVSKDGQFHFDQPRVMMSGAAGHLLMFDLDCPEQVKPEHQVARKKRFDKDAATLVRRYEEASGLELNAETFRIHRRDGQVIVTVQAVLP